MKYRECYEAGLNCLKKNGCTNPETDARLLLEYVCHTDRNTLLAHPDREVSKEEKKGYDAFIERRSKGEPLQYITGEQDFMGLTFHTHSSTLIPRFDTECLVEEAMKELHDGMRILDMCTGSGCILLSLLKYSNGCEGVGVDLSSEAVALAKRNASELGIPAVFLQGDLFEPVEGRFEMIVSNPPYIRSDVIPTLDREVKEYEPLSALDGGTDGLDFYRRIVKDGKDYLKRGGVLLFEIGYDQGEEIREILIKEGYRDVSVRRDLAGKDRVVVGRFYE